MDEIEPADLPQPDGSVPVSCPYCGVAVDLGVDPWGGALQRYVEDCEVCCRPWSVTVRVAPDGRADVEVRTLDET